MQLQPEQILSLARDITTIKWLLAIGLFLLAVFVIAALSTVYMLYLSLTALKDQQSGKIYRNKAEDLIAKACYDELIQESKQRLQTHPNDVWTHWYLGQAHFYTKKWIDSKHCFKRVLELEPGWYSSVDSFLDKIEQGIKENGPRLVE